jgi:serine/threonine-protein kinase
VRALLDEGLPRERALALARQIASGLAAAHAEGVVHGDLKPANIMVTSEDVAKILDFGLSVSRIQRAAECAAANDGLHKSRSDDPDATLIAELPDGDAVGRIHGTPAYMSPAQASGLPSKAASDVFSFGLILFEMLTGERAMRDEAPLKIVLRLQHEDVAAELRSRLSDSDADLVLPLLAREPAARPTMADVAESVNGLPHAET